MIKTLLVSGGNSMTSGFFTFGLLQLNTNTTVVASSC